MTEILTKIVVDCSTNEQIEVPLTAEEIAQREADAQAFAEQEAARQAQEAAATEAKVSAIAKLTALGLSDAEVKAFLG